MTAATVPATSADPAKQLQFQAEGRNLGLPDATVLDFTGDRFEVAVDDGVITVTLDLPDPNFNETVLLFHYDDADDLTNIFDSSIAERGRPNLFFGAAISTAAAKFGTTSGSFGGRAQYRHDADMELSADFTIETFVRLVAYPAVAGFVVIKSISSGFHPYALSINPSGILTATGWSTAPAQVYSISSVSPVTLDEWHFVVLERFGSTFKLWIDGVAIGTATFAGALYSNTTHPLCIGQASDDNYGLSGYLAETRITRVARYQAAATIEVPTRRWPDKPMPLDIIYENKVASSSKRWTTVVFCAAFGDKFVAGGVNQSTGRPCAMYSTDRGQTWTESPTSFPSTGGDGFRARGMAFGNGVCVAPASATQMFITEDGVEWDLVAGSPNYTAVEMYFDNGVFVTFATNTALLYTSTDGLSWTARALPASRTWNCGAGNGAGVHVIAAGDGGTAVSLDNGATWADGGLLPFGVSPNFMAYGNGVWVVTPLAITDVVAYSTDNGASWQLSDAVYKTGSQIYQRVRYIEHALNDGTDDSAFVMLDVTGTHTHRSFDGVVWFAITPIPNMPSFSKDWDHDGEGNFVVVGEDGSPTTVVAVGEFAQ